MAKNMHQAINVGKDLFSSDVVAKSLTTGYDINPGTMVDGGAIRRESLSNEITQLSFSLADFTMATAIAKVPTQSPVEQYDIMTSYGNNSRTGFSREMGISPINDVSIQRKNVNMKHLSDTRRIATVLGRMGNTNIVDPIAMETEAGILQLYSVIEDTIFYGDADLTADAQGQGLEFDGLAKLVDKDNVIDMRGETLTEQALNNGSILIRKAFGHPNVVFMPVETKSLFVNEQLTRQVVIQPSASIIKSGFDVDGFQSTSGALQLYSSTIMGRNQMLNEADGMHANAPIAPSKVEASVVAKQEALFTDEDVASDLLEYKVIVKAESGQSLAVDGSVKLDAKDSAVKLAVEVPAVFNAQPTHIEVYRKALNGQFYLIQSVAFRDAVLSGNVYKIEATDKNEKIPGTTDVFIAEMNRDVMGLFELGGMSRTPLAQIDASQTFTIEWWGALYLKNPKRVAHLKNVRAM